MCSSKLNCHGAQLARTTRTIKLVFRGLPLALPLAMQDLVCVRLGLQNREEIL